MDTLRAQLLGTWKLSTSTQIISGIEKSGIFGSNTQEILIYSADNYMPATLMHPDRPYFHGSDLTREASSENIVRGSSNEKISAFDSFFSYSGPFEVNESERFVLHKVEYSSYPNWTGTEQKRFLELDNTCLKLTTPEILSQEKSLVGGLSRIYG